MPKEKIEKTQKGDLFDIGSLFRTSATLTFIVQIVAFILMIASIVGFYLGDFFPMLDQDLQVLLLLVIFAIMIMVFLGALSLFLRFSRRIGNAVIGPGIEQVRLDSPKVKLVVYSYGILVTLMGVIGIYIWYIINNRFLIPWIVSEGGSILLSLFSYAMGAFFIALMIQVIIAVVGRSSTKIIVEVLNADDSEFLR